MRKIYVLIACIAILGSFTLFGCKSKQQLTPAQKEAIGEGRVKKERDECQQLALNAKGEVLRAWGEGVSSKESFATNLAELDARTKIARQLVIVVEALIRNFNDQYSKDGVLDESGKAQELQDGYVNKILTGTVPICSNAYVMPNGNIQVYVCVELAGEKTQEIVKQLAKETKLNIDFAERNFRKEMEEARERFNQSQR